ncbi:sigma-54-dependent transcriptional regulator [Desulfogranum japonicum]|uniref:sigma-54-dependent transcriptional regulator n=1 Tax=Desulfogranum japonicum TaxID=231447 RepID=UPI00040A4688|nr:sigma-54 dependent transcriptional regulator [Desulfogranum japonicum]
MTSKTLLVIDDDMLFCKSIASLFASTDIHVVTVSTGEQGLSWCKHNHAEVILLDQKLPDGEGLKLCEPLLALQDQLKIIFITAFPSFNHAVQALRNGAYDYLSKPLELEELELAIDKAFRTAELERIEQVKRYHDRRKSTQSTPVGIKGGLQQISKMLHLAANSRVPVLITGETGTGKNVIAKSIHYLRDHPEQNFVSTNCAALPENLIEAELFGHEKGAFTGAEQSKKGLFEMADKGTLFLDEIGEIPLHLQAKLLGALDDGSIKRLGGAAARRVQVRIIAATNVNLEEAIKQKKFREDLYYRLSVLHIHLPPLRERTQDIADLCMHFIQHRIPDGSVSVPDDEMEKLQAYHWPGNVRELKNIIERAIILRSGSALFPSKWLGNSVPPSPVQAVESQQPIVNREIIPLQIMEKKHIRKVLDHFDGNHTQTAKALGIARSTLMRKIDQYCLKPGDSK